MSTRTMSTGGGVPVTAKSILLSTSYFCNASDELLDALSEIMVPVKAEKGRIFVDEGEPMHSIIVVESGSLVRTKLSVTDDRMSDMRLSLRSLNAANKHKEIVKNSVVIDYVEGRGRVTGLLHACQGGISVSEKKKKEEYHPYLHEAIAYATVSVSSDECKVWLMNAQDFRDIISGTPDFCLEMLNVMAQELRVGSKSLRGLIEKAKHDGKQTSGDDDENEEDEEEFPDGKKKKKKKIMLKVLCYDTTSWVSEGFKPRIEQFNALQLEKSNSTNEEDQPIVQIVMDFTTERLSERSATYAAGYRAVCVFVNDAAGEKTLQTLSLMGVRMVALRCAGFDRVDMRAALAYGFTVARVPAYSPHAVAEHAASLLMAVNRKIAKASARVKMANFTLDAGLMGMDIHGKTIGVMGTGKIGQILCDICFGFTPAKLLCYDVYEAESIKQKGGVYVSKEELYRESDIIFLMMPLLPATYHAIDDAAIELMKPGVILVNTSRGGLVDTAAVLRGLQSGKIGGVGMDVYEHEQQYFFQDWSAKTIADANLVNLLGQHNVVLTAHQAFFTKEAVDSIVDTTLQNLLEYANGKTGFNHPNNCIPDPNKK